MATDGGRWISIIKRIDGSISFTENFENFATRGIGIPGQTTEYAIALDALHELTSSATFELLVEASFNG